GGKLDRQGTRREDATLHRLDQLGEMAVAVVEAALRVGDADDRASEHLARVAHALRERAPKIEGKRRVAVVGEALSQSLRLRLAHCINPRGPAPRRSLRGG